MTRSNSHTLEEIRDEVTAASYGNQDYRTSIVEFVSQMSSLSEVKGPKGEMVLTPSGLRQLAIDYLKIPGAVLGMDLRPETKFEIVKEMALHNPEQEIWIRANNRQIGTVVSAEYAFLDNSQLVWNLWQMQEDGVLPDDLRAQDFHLSPNGRQMTIRFMSDTWLYHMARDGGDGLHYGNLGIGNSEDKSLPFQATVFMTRHMCTNSMFSNALFNIKHIGNGNGGDPTRKFLSALHNAVGMIGQYTAEMFQQLEDTRHIGVQQPLLLFEKVKEEWGLPTFAFDEAKTYYENHVAPGANPNLYDAIEAISAGLRSYTRISGGSLREPQWEKRQTMEGKLGALAVTLRQTHMDGKSVDDYYLKGDIAIKEAIARYVETYVSEIPIAKQIADGVRTLDINPN